MEDSPCLLAAVVYRPGISLEDVLASVRARLAAEGKLRLAGVIPRLGALMSNGRPTLLLDDIESGETMVISEDRGPGAESCILDSDALTRMRARLSGAILRRPDVLFLGRFAKEELRGHGIREEIGLAVAAGIPCIVGIQQTTLPGFAEFTGGEFVSLPPEVDAIVDWVGCVTAASA